jgi:hypothetical protein
VITLMIAIVALAVTFFVLRTPAKTSTGRVLEAAAIVAVTPLVTSYSWGTHLVLLLLPMLALIAWSIPRRDWTVVSLVAVGYLLLGPAHKGMQVLLVTGYSNLVVLRLLAELGVIGVLSVWAASLLAVRRVGQSPSSTAS